MPIAQVRFTLASNSNRGLRKVVLAPAHVNIARLQVLAKDKLRLRGVGVFYTDSGAELAQGDSLQEDMLVLASRGEAFVGAPPPAPAPQPDPSSLPEAVQSSFPRAWLQGRGPCNAAVTLRIQSFNILAPCLAQGSKAAKEIDPTAQVSGWGVRYLKRPQGVTLPHNFACSQGNLDWAHRFPRLRSELLQHSPDVLCLQEMDATAFRDCQALLEANGYSRGVCSQAKGGAPNFVAVFWRVDRLEAVGEPEIVYLTAQGTIAAIIQRLRVLLATPEPCACWGDEDQGRQRACPPCGGDGVRADAEDAAPTSFLVMTAHLKAGLKEKDEQDRAKQANDMLSVLDKFARPGEDVVLAGDFNSHLQALPFSAAPGSGVGAPDLPALVLPRLARGGFRCAVHEGTGGGHMAFSQWCRRCDVEIKSVIDHILLRGPGVSAHAALAAPDDASVAAAGCLPSAAHPSDHIPVVVDVSLRRRTASSCVGVAPSRPVAPPPAAMDMSESELLTLGQDLPHEGRVCLTGDGFKYVALPKEWQASRGHLARAASAAYARSSPELLAADRAALERHLVRRQGEGHAAVPAAPAGAREWGFWSPPSCVGLHISLGKHADGLNVGRRVRFQVRRLLHFQTRKLGEPSSPGGPGAFCARWFTFEVRLVDQVRCEGEEPHISFAVFGARPPE